MRVGASLLLLLSLLTLGHAPRTGDADRRSYSPPLAAVTVDVPPAYVGTPPFDRPRTLSLPPGFRVSVYAAGLESPRQIAFSPTGVLFSADIRSGTIMAHPDRDGDGVSAPSETVVFAAGLWAPHSLAWDGADLYVGAHNQVVRFSDFDGDLAPDREPWTVASLPTFGDQITRTVVVSPDRQLYVGVGSSTNASPESDPRRAAIVRYERDGSGQTVIASGLRNPVGLAFHPVTGELWSTDVGVDHLGEEHPFEEINRIEPGGHYGWPYCFEDRLPDTLLYPLEGPAFCPRTRAPLATLPAHTTPLGLTFYLSDQFPAEYRGRLFVALHGSSKRLRQAGYGVVSVTISDEADAARVEPFADGWLLDPDRTPDQPDQNWGRPVALAVGPDGSLYISSDAYGAVYRVWYAP